MIGIWFLSPAILFVVATGIIWLLIQQGKLKLEWDPPITPSEPCIPLDSPCPACGHRGCELDYLPTEKKVRRKCKTCSCLVWQDPIEPKYFTK